MVKDYSIVHFKRLGSHGFHDTLNHYLCFFSKHDKYCKVSQIFKRCSLNDFHKYKTSMGLHNGKKT